MRTNVLTNYHLVSCGCRGTRDEDMAEQNAVYSWRHRRRLLRKRNVGTIAIENKQTTTSWGINAGRALHRHRDILAPKRIRMSSSQHSRIINLNFLRGLLAPSRQIFLIKYETNFTGQWIQQWNKITRISWATSPTSYNEINEFFFHNIHSTKLKSLIKKKKTKINILIHAKQ